MEYNFSDKISNLKPSAIREIFKSLSDKSIISFAAGNPSSESFPVTDFARLSQEIFAQMPATALQYGITEGFTPLREVISDRLRKNKHIYSYNNNDCSYKDETIIVSGGQQGIELTCKVFCNEGDVVICENPSFIGALNAFRSLGAKTVGVDLDFDGINIESLEQILKQEKRAKILYLIPTFQNPTGITMSKEKREKVYELAYKYNLVILEDNPYGELRFCGQDIPTIKSIDKHGIVVYCSSFSKILSSGMRVGYINAAEEIVQKIVVAKQSEDVHTNLFFQILCHKFLTQCDIDSHIQNIRKLYFDKCSLMLNELQSSMPKEVSFTKPEGGIFIWCTLPDYVDMQRFVKAAINAKVAVVPGQTFNCDTAHTSQSFRLNYSTSSDEQIIEGIKILSNVAKSFIK